MIIFLRWKNPDGTLLMTDHDGDKVINGLMLTSTLSHLAGELISAPVHVVPQYLILFYAMEQRSGNYFTTD